MDVQARNSVDDKTVLGEGKHKDAKDQHSKLEESTDVGNEAEDAVGGSGMHMLHLVQVNGLLSQNS